MGENHVEIRRKREERRAFETELARDEKPVVKALRNVRVRVDSVWDIVNTSEPYPDALPIRTEHLQHSYHPRTLEGIARALAVRGRFAIEHAWPVALEMFVKTEADEEIDEPRMRGLKQGLAATLSVLCTEERLQQIFDLIRDPSHGDSRGLLIAGLREFRKNKKAWEFLQSLRADPYWGDLAQQVARGGRGC